MRPAFGCRQRAHRFASLLPGITDGYSWETPHLSRRSRTLLRNVTLVLRDSLITLKIGRVLDNEGEEAGSSAN
jgi:hypothetical protein